MENSNQLSGLNLVRKDLIVNYLSAAIADFDKTNLSGYGFWQYLLSSECHEAMREHYVGIAEEAGIWVHFGEPVDLESWKSLCLAWRHERSRSRKENDARYRNYQRNVEYAIQNGIPVSFVQY